MQANAGVGPGEIATGGVEPPRPGAMRGVLQPAGRWLGVFYLVFSLGGNMLVRLDPSNPRPWFEPTLILMAAAVLLVGVPLVARTWKLWVPLGLLVVWIGAGVVSAWALTGSVPVASVRWTVILAALFVAAAVTRPAWSGGAVLALGTLHVAVHVVVYWKNYYSLGASFPSSGLWWSTSYGWSSLPLPARTDWVMGGAPVLGLPYPQGAIERLGALIVEVPQVARYQFFGLTGNPNYTGDYLAPFLVFAVALLLRPVSVRLPVLPRALTSAVILMMGLLVLHVLDARSALLAVVVGLVVLVVPVSWARRGVVPYAAAVGVPFLLLAPPLVSWTTGAWFTGRSCVWRSWRAAVQDSPAWGVGAPGQLMDVCPNPVFIVNAHNELLQAWSVGGAIGLLSFTFFIAVATWMAARHSDLDGRVLLAVVTTCVALLGMEVISTDWAIAWLVPIVARSIALFTVGEPVVRTVGEDRPRLQRRAVT